MQKKITVIITIRNREGWRIENQIASIRASGANPHFHIVDYGSDIEYAQEYQNICNNLDLQYTHMYSEGLPWNKCRAINYGVRKSTTPFIVTSDVDILYENNPFQWCLDNYQANNMYHINGYWLKKNNNKAKAQDAGHGNYGFFLFIAKSAFDEIGGYDERMVYWGLEDLDWPNRLKLKGYTQVWLPNEYKIYHQWHPESENNHKRPITASINTLRYACQNKLHPVLTADWGHSVTLEDRPILTEIKTSKPHIVSLNTNVLTKYEGADILLESKKNGFVKLELGSRLKNRPLDMLRKPIKKMLKPFTALTGNTVQSNVNQNFDVLYELFPLLTQNGLLDYYIPSDLSYIYLLWRT